MNKLNFNTIKKQLILGDGMKLFFAEERINSLGILQDLKSCMIGWEE
jgi:hypothetical protein